MPPDAETIRRIHATAVERLCRQQNWPEWRARQWLATAALAFQGRSDASDYRPAVASPCHQS